MDNKVLAIVNGKEITQEIFDFTMSKFPQDRKVILILRKEKRNY